MRSRSRQPDEKRPFPGSSRYWQLNSSCHPGGSSWVVGNPEVNSANPRHRVVRRHQHRNARCPGFAPCFGALTREPLRTTPRYLAGLAGAEASAENCSTATSCCRVSAVGPADVHSPHITFLLETERRMKGILGEKLKLLVGKFADVLRQFLVASPELGQSKGLKVHRRGGPSAYGRDFPERTCWRTVSSKAEPAPPSEKSRSISASHMARSRSAIHTASLVWASSGSSSIARWISAMVIMVVFYREMPRSPRTTPRCPRFAPCFGACHLRASAFRD